MTKFKVGDIVAPLTLGDLQFSIFDYPQAVVVSADFIVCSEDASVLWFTQDATKFEKIATASSEVLNTCLNRLSQFKG